MGRRVNGGKGMIYARKKKTRGQERGDESKRDGEKKVLLKKKEAPWVEEASKKKRMRDMGGAKD